MAVPTDDQYVLVREEADWHWDKQSMKSHLGERPISFLRASQRRGGVHVPLFPRKKIEFLPCSSKISKDVP